jgi:hypothetical protein
VKKEFVMCGGKKMLVARVFAAWEKYSSGENWTGKRKDTCTKV